MRIQRSLAIPVGLVAVTVVAWGAYALLTDEPSEASHQDRRVELVLDWLADQPGLENVHDYGSEAGHFEAHVRFDGDLNAEERREIVRRVEQYMDRKPSFRTWTVGFRFAGHSFDATNDADATEGVIAVVERLRLDPRVAEVDVQDRLGDRDVKVAVDVDADALDLYVELIEDQWWTEGDPDGARLEVIQLTMAPQRKSHRWAADAGATVPAAAIAAVREAAVDDDTVFRVNAGFDADGPRTTLEVRAADGEVRSQRRALLDAGYGAAAGEQLIVQTHQVHRGVTVTGVAEWDGWADALDAAESLAPFCPDVDVDARSLRCHVDSTDDVDSLLEVLDASTAGSEVERLDLEVFDFRVSLQGTPAQIRDAAALAAAAGETAAVVDVDLDGRQLDVLLDEFVPAEAEELVAAMRAAGWPEQLTFTIREAGDPAIRLWVRFTSTASGTAQHPTIELDRRTGRPAHVEEGSPVPVERMPDDHPDHEFLSIWNASAS